MKFYCEACDKARPVEIEPLASDELNGDKIWGDIICSECRFVIVTVEADEPGRYEFVKVAELEAA